MARRGRLVSWVAAVAAAAVSPAPEARLVAPAPVGTAQVVELAASRAASRARAWAVVRQAGGAGRRERAVGSPGSAAVVVAALRARPADRRGPAVEQRARPVDEQAPRGELRVPLAGQRERVVVSRAWEAAAAAQQADQRAPAVAQQARAAASLARAGAAVAPRA
jgi:hypothetical protein